MYFQVSPVRSVKPKPKALVKNEEDEIARLILAPFTATPKLSFQDVTVNESHRTKLIITNPRKTALIVSAIFDGPDELELSLSWCEKSIEENSSNFLELVWCPTSEYAARHSLRLTCQKQLWNIPIGFKSILPKKSKQKKKPTTTLVKRTSPLAKSNLTRKSTHKLLSTSTSLIKRNPVWNDKPLSLNSKRLICSKENVNTNISSESFVSPSNMSFNFHPCDNIRRQTYAINKLEIPKKNHISPNFDDSLELKSPDRPTSYNGRTILKQIHANNTPSLEELLQQKLHPPHLDVTPVGQIFQPKRVSTEMKNENYESHHIENSHLIRNLCWEMKSNSQPDLPKINISSETHVIGNLSFESQLELDSNTYVKQNMSTETYTKHEETFESTTNDKWLASTYRNGFRSTFNSFPASPEQRSNNSPKNSTNNVYNNLSHNMASLSAIQEDFGFSYTDIAESSGYNKMKRKSSSTFTFSPPKRQNLSPETWSKVGGIYSARKCVERSTRTSRKLNKRDGTPEKGISFIETKIFSIRDPFILAATTSIDPFLTNTIYLDQEWIAKQELRFKRWFNMLLTPPTELNVADDGQSIDAARIWRECSKKEVAVAPTKEMVCNKYHTVSKLDILRNSAMKMYKSDEVQGVLCKVSSAIDAGKLEIRQDRNVHLDLSLQSKIMSLLLSYNPLWLRISLETIYNEKLQLASNSDVMGLSKFLYDRFFKDPYLFRRHKTVHSPKYTAEIKKFILKKFLAIVYFLDCAKNKTLIGHDPCLFRRNASVKESREMLIQFSKDAITAGVGDITKYLKYFGYTVHHKQLYLQEFDYAVNSLGGDLRDGVRLTRVMEIILLRNDLTKNLRVPAISRLQKIHNVKLVFQSLYEAGYEIQHEIEPYHIVDGHREKTLSFLWQIIYKFQAPMIVKTVRNIQSWWRSLPVCIKRNRLRKIYNNKMEAAFKIQKWYKNQILGRKLITFSSLLSEYLQRLKRERAAVKIQSYFRMYRERNKYLKIRCSIIKLQKQCRKWFESICYRKRICAAVVLQKNVRKFLARSRFMKLKQAVLVIEKVYKSQQLMIAEKQYYQTIRSSAIIIQKWFKATIEMKKVRNKYLILKKTVCFIQQKYRSKQLMKTAVVEFQSMKSSTIMIQNWYRSIKTTKKQRNNFLQMKNSVRMIEELYIAQREMKRTRTYYLTLRRSAILIQRRVRATFEMRKYHQKYLLLKKSVDFVKTKYKANKEMLLAKKNYQRLRKAVLFVQRRFRANQLMKIERTSFIHKRNSALVIQYHFKAYILMKKMRKEYLEIKMSCIKIQRGYKAYKAMYIAKNKYELLRKAVILVQTKFRANRLMRNQRQEFLKAKASCTIIQRYFRSYLMMKKERKEYLMLKSSVCFVQKIYRAKMSMQICRKRYIELREVSVFIQRRFRANKLMDIERKAYIQLKSAVDFIKTKYNANKMMVTARREFQNLRKTVVFVQRKFRANRIMRINRDLYLRKRKAAISIQNYFKSYLLMKSQKKLYLDMKVSATIIQRRYKAHKAMLMAEQYYLNLRKAAILVQRKYRANKIMRIERSSYLQRRMSAIFIQNYFKSYLLMRNQRKMYLEIKVSATIIQQRYRAYKAMSMAKQYFKNLKKVTIFIQGKYRANKLMKIERNLYLEKRRAAIIIQTQFRSYLLMKKDRKTYIEKKKSVIIIQQWYMAYKSMFSLKKEYESMRRAVKLIQNRFRCHKLMKIQRQHFLEQKKSCVLIQRYFRGFLLMKRDRQNYVLMKKAVSVLQVKYRAKKSMQSCKRTYLELKRTTIYIQRIFRANKLMKFQRSSFLKQKQAAIKIQKYFRSYLQMKIDRTVYLSTISAVVSIQRYARGLLTRKKYAHLLTPEAKEERRIRKIQDAAATKIQACWRGFHQRSIDGNAMKNIRTRSIEARNNADPNNSLGSRSERALELLVSETISLPFIIAALSDFEYVTRRSSVICRDVGPFLPEQLYILIKSVARSLPEIQICVLATNILINLCKYPPTTHMTWFPEHLDSMLSIMLHWCDKEEMAFPGLVTLFWLFAHNEEYKRVILDLPNLNQKLEKINGLVLRKQKMVLRSGNKSVLLASKFYPKKTLPLPGLRPDWGFDYPDRPKTFTNSVHAIDCLIEILKSS